MERARAVADDDHGKWNAIQGMPQRHFTRHREVPFVMQYSREWKENPLRM